MGVEKGKGREIRGERGGRKGHMERDGERGRKREM